MRYRVLSGLAGQRRIGSKRQESGFYLVELLVAVFVSSLLASALASNLTGTTRLSTGGQNQILAAAIAQELMDNARNTTYSTLQTNIGTQTMLVNKTMASQAGPAMEPRPLMLDIVDSNWSTPSEHNAFTGSASETIAAGPYANTLIVTVTINWREGRGNKTYTLSTLVSQYGIHSY